MKNAYSLLPVPNIGMEYNIPQPHMIIKRGDKMRKKQGRKGWLLFSLLSMCVFPLIGIGIWMMGGKRNTLQGTEQEEIPPGQTVAEKKQEIQADGQKEEKVREMEEEVNMLIDIDEIKRMEAGSILDMTGLDSSFTKELFFIEPITDPLYEKINGVSYRENDKILREDLKYLRVLYIGFDGETHIGELIVNERIAGDVLDIMGKLYENAYPIEKMVLIDQYGGDDNLSMADNNSSAFNYRMVAGTNYLSKHGMGLAIDINPRYNPYVRTGKNGETIIEPENGTDYVERSKEFDYKIDENDLCYQLFVEHGFTWGGNWNSVKDYQHFEKAID